MIHSKFFAAELSASEFRMRLNQNMAEGNPTRGRSRGKADPDQ